MSLAGSCGSSIILGGSRQTDRCRLPAYGAVEYLYEASRCLRSLAAQGTWKIRRANWRCSISTPKYGHHGYPTSGSTSPWLTLDGVVGWVALCDPSILHAYLCIRRALPASISLRPSRWHHPTSITTGTWSEGWSSPRTPLSTTTETSRSATVGESRAWSILKPLFFAQHPAW